MKIAMVEWWPRICGPTDWLTHLYAGRREGDQVDLLTFSPSGRWLTPWNARLRDQWQVRSQAQAVKVLNEYDLVIMADLICRAPEVRKRHLTEDGLPWYLGVLRQMRTPWLTIAHDQCYPTAENEHLKAVLSTPSFLGALGVTRSHSTARVEPLAPRPIHWVRDPYLPYDASSIEWKPRGTGKRGVLHLGRVTTNKGQDVTMRLANALTGDVNFWGYNAYGTPSQAWALWELGLGFGYAELEFPKSSRPTHTHPRVFKFYTGEWKQRTPSGNVIAYRGPYRELTDVDWEPGVAVMFTGPTLQATMEYAQLDAVAAGALLILPANQIAEATYTDIVTLPYRHARFAVSKKTGQVKQTAEDWDENEIVSIINRWLQAEPAEFLAKLEAQRRELVRHDPRRVFANLLERVTPFIAAHAQNEMTTV